MTKTYRMQPMDEVRFQNGSAGIQELTVTYDDDAHRIVRSVPLEVSLAFEWLSFYSRLIAGRATWSEEPKIFWLDANMTGPEKLEHITKFLMIAIAIGR